MEQRIKDSFHQQQFMQTLGARLVSVEKGVVVIECDYHLKLTQQHQYIHAGAISTLADTACGYAALSMMDNDKEVLSIEFKSSMMRPAKAEKLIATGRVIKSGRRITFCEAVVTDETGEIEFSRMTATMISVNK
ncbi:MAG: PaaI family thioesterase [Chitinophagales bacterium]